MLRIVQANRLHPLAFIQIVYLGIMKKNPTSFVPYNCTVLPRITLAQDSIQWMSFSELEVAHGPATQKFWYLWKPIGADGVER